MTNKDIVSGFIEEVWGGGCTDRVADYVGEDYVSVGLRSKVEHRGVDGVVRNVAGTRARYPNLRVVIRELVAEADTVACHVSLHSGGDAANENEARMDEMAIFRLRDNKLIECVSIGTGWK